MNNVIITGRLVKDPELREVKETYVVSIVVAVEEKTKGEAKVSYIPVTAWGSVASAVAKYLVKGSHVLVRGKLVQKVYKNTEGKTVSRIEITSDTIEFLSPRSHKADDNHEAEDEISDELPF